MIKHIKNFQNLGVDSSIDREIEKKIRLANSMSIIGISTACVVLLYGLVASWPFPVMIFIGVSIVATLVPPTLNFFKKNFISRISFLLIANGFTVAFALIVGPDLHFQYFLFALLGLPLIFLGKENFQKKIFWSATGILSFIYIECHFYFFEFPALINIPYSKTISLINDALIGIMILAQYYFFVYENEHYIEEIKDKSNELREKNTQLEHFAYIASHDLKEPMRTVSSFVDIIKEEYGTTTDNNLNTYFTFIDDSLKRMQEMIQGLLNYSRIGKSNQAQKLDLDHLFKEVLNDLEVLIKEEKAVIHYHDLPTIYGFKMEMQQLLQNLMTNAIKFQNPDHAPIINFSWRELSGFWEFCIEDNGIGIPEKKHKEIFQMFTKLHLSSKYQGNGIGLAFCKKIVELHNGKIWVESSPKNGSKFYFTIQKMNRDL